VRTRGDLVFTAGQVADDASGAILESTEIEDHIRKAFENLRESLAVAGARLEHVVKTTVYLTDVAHYPALKKVRAEFFSEPYPTSTALVTQLVDPSLLFEIEAVAELPAD
jgi:enamine deaminase RidA (YjgF/YER057c/UK114 family)